MKEIDKSDRQRIGNKIRQIRMSKGLTLADLAKLIDKDDSNLSKIEYGKYSISIDALSKICEALGCKVDIIINE